MEGGDGVEHNSTILIVDDEPIGRETLETLLIGEGYSLLFAADGPEALSKAAELAPDLILLDVMMPGMDGFEVCQRLRDDQVLAEVPVIMVTALDDRDSRLRGIEAGADDFVTKPFDRVELRSRVRTITRLNRYRRLLLTNQQLESRIAQLCALYDISNALNSIVDTDVLLKSIVQKAGKLLAVQVASILLWDQERDSLYFSVVVAEEERIERELKRIHLATDLGIVGWVFREGKPALVPDVNTDGRFCRGIDERTGFTTSSILCVPLCGKEGILGVLEAVNKRDGEFTEEDEHLLETIGSNIAASIERANLYRELQGAEALTRHQNIELRETVEALQTAIKALETEIAERKRVEAALEEERALLARRIEERTADLSAANAELARASRLKDEFLANMSHELRTPLNAILGMSESLLEEIFGPVNEKQAKYLRSIEESGRHLLDLINDILDVSKVEAGKLELSMNTVSVESICQSSLKFIKQSAQKKQLRVSSSLDSLVTMIRADERRLKQILVNLLSNAVKFTDAGGAIGLEVTGDMERQVIHFTVWDTGIGFSQEQMARLFKPFVQLDSSLSRQYTGTGLGLALVHRLVDLHNGSVSVESQVGKGSRFTVSLPWQEPRVFETARGARQVESGEVGIYSIRRVLIIEDSRFAADQIARYLTELGVEPVIHHQGEGAVDIVLKVQPDVIILDILLPDISGWDVLAQLKAEQRTREVPVLIISVVDDRARGLELGAIEHLVKPVSREQLQQGLSKALLPDEERSKDSIMMGSEGGTTGKAVILLAEDNEGSINTVSDYLLAKGYRVIVARNGEEAIQRVEEGKPDLILMDIQMPGMDGLEATRKIRADTDLMDIPIIALTALAMPGDRERCLEAGANDYVSKPVSLRDLVKRVETQLNQNRTEEDNLT
jgi:CheY-like chemotaxis protein